MDTAQLLVVVVGVGAPMMSLLLKKEKRTTQRMHRKQRKLRMQLESFCEMKMEESFINFYKRFISIFKFVINHT